MLPRPTMPTVSPCSAPVRSPGTAPLHTPARTWRSSVTILRFHASSRASAWLATSRTQMSGMYELVRVADEGQRAHARGDVGQRGLAVGEVALAARLDDVDVVGPRGHDDGVWRVRKSVTRRIDSARCAGPRQSFCTSRLGARPAISALIGAGWGGAVPGRSKNGVRGGLK